MTDLVATLPPQDLEAEQAVLSSLMLGGSDALEAAQPIEATDFYAAAHQETFRAALELIEAGALPEPLALKRALERRGTLEEVGGAAFVAELYDVVGTAANAGHYAERVRDARQRRELLVAGHRAAEAAVAPGSNGTHAAREAAKEASRIATRRAKPRRRPKPGDAADRVWGTEVWFARELIARTGADLRYVAAWKAWLVYDVETGLWRRDETGEVERRAKELAYDLIGAEGRRLVDLAAKRGDIPAGVEHAEEALKTLKKYWGRRSLQNAVALAQTEIAVVAGPRVWDSRADLLGVPNGAVDLTTGQLVTPTRADHVTKVAGAPFDPAAACPMFDAVLERSLPDPELRDYFQRALGAMLWGGVRDELLHVCHGGGANGKGTIFGAVRRAMGEYAIELEPAVVMAGTRALEVRADLARLHGVRAAFVEESEDRKRLAVAQVKRLTGGDSLVARRLYEQPFEFVPTHKIMLATNHQPRVPDDGHAVWRRLRLVPFTVQIPERERDHDLKEKIGRELPGVLRRLIEWHLAYRERGLEPVRAVDAATRQYREDEDDLGRFMSEETERATQGFVPARTLHMAYLRWCDDEGAPERGRMGQRSLVRSLRDRGLEQQQRGGARGFGGIALRRDPPEPTTSTAHSERETGFDFGEGRRYGSDS